MNSSVIATEMLKFVNLDVSFLHSIKFMISGWSTLMIPMFAPLLTPPCLMVSVAALKTDMKEIGPLAVPAVDWTLEPDGLRLEKSKPVPPPDLWISAASLTALKMPSIESSTGRTKQALRFGSSRPAFIRVGEFGMKSLPAISS